MRLEKLARLSKIPDSADRLILLLANSILLFLWSGSIASTHAVTEMNAAGVNHGREKALQSIIESANKASSLESWGMPVEATAEYSRYSYS